MQSPGNKLAINHANISENVDLQECVEGVTNVNLCSESNEDTSDGSTGTVDSCIDGVGFLEVTGKQQSR